MSKYLITGGLGVIGSLVAKRWLDQGHEVVLVDNGVEPRNRWIESKLIGPGVFVKRYGIEECAADLVPTVDYVLHAGASTGIPYSVTAPAEDWRNNVDATLALLESLRKTPKPTVVLSSIKPYRVLPMPLNGLDENSVLEPDEPYAASKAAQSMVCQAYAKSYGLPVNTFRCSNLYGPAPCHGPRHGWLTWFCISAAIGRPIEVQGTGDQCRDMLHANDVASAVEMGLKLAEAGLAGEVFNLGGGRSNLISVNQAANLLQGITDVEIVKGPPRAMDDDRVYIDHAKFSLVSGWYPKVSVLDGLRDTLAWAGRNKEALHLLYDGVK